MVKNNDAPAGECKDGLMHSARCYDSSSETKNEIGWSNRDTKKKKVSFSKSGLNDFHPSTLKQHYSWFK